MKLNWLTLKFSGNLSKLEAPFQSDYYRLSLRHVRISLILGALFYAAFGILDAVLMPEQKSTIWLIRFVIVCPTLCATFLASLSKSFERFMQPFLAGVFIIAGGGIICMIIIAPTPVNYSYYAGLLLVSMWFYTFMRILFTWAFLAGCVQVILYEIAAIWIRPTPFEVLLNNNFFFISANVIGMLACYSIEFYARRDFFLRHQLEIEQENTSKINQELEEHVEKRTADYQTINLTLKKEIASHKQDQEALRQSEERYRKLVENANDIVFRTDASGHFTFVNQAALSITGYKEEAIIGMHYTELIHPNMREEAIKHLGRQFVKRIHNTYSEYIIIKKDGQEAWLAQNTQLIVEDGNVKGFQAVSRDITERKHAQDALQKSEEKYRSILENIDDGYYEVDLAGSFTFFNASMCLILGYPQEEMMGMNNRQYTDKESAKKLFVTFNKVYRTGQPAKEFDWEIIKINGTKRFIQASVGLIKDSSNKPAGFRGIVRDITEHKLLEEERRILQERLQQADKMESIGTLAGGIAHDFNNMLMGIQGYASLLLMNLDPSHPNYERLTQIEELVQNGADLTKQLLGFARGGRYEVKPTDMNTVIEKTSSLFGRTKKEITIHRKLGKDLWSVEVDRGQMEQVFLNLYVNAWQAMPGGGDIHLETEKIILDDKKASAYSVKPGKYVKVSVTDNGTGMDEKTRERIFDPFFTTKEMGRGTGLGMATVYGIIKGHQGMINVYSEPGHGTTFTIYLPASEKDAVKKKTATGTIARGRETILLVDDEKMVLEVNSELLASLGYKVYAASSGQEAISVYMEKKDKIDLVILDMIMPGISGSETFDRLREINPGIKVLLSSGYSLTGKAKTIMDRGCNGFLQKPFHLEQLSNKVREILD